MNSITSHLFIYIFVYALVAFVSHSFKLIECRKSNFFRVFIFHFLDSVGRGHHTTLPMPLQMNKVVSWKGHLLWGPEKKKFDFLR